MLEKLPVSVGEALQNQRAGVEQTVIERLRPQERVRLEVSSPALASDRAIPVRYTADGPGISPPLHWSAVPPGTESVAILVEDADSPTPHPLVHAIVVNVDPRDSSLIEGALDSPDHSGVGLATGPNSFLAHAWLPPDPPPGHGVHRYVFQVFALRRPPFEAAPGREELFRAVDEFAVGVGAVIGTYERAERARKHETALTDRSGPVETSPSLTEGSPVAVG
jgi:Raf kinase inhibitor-like YbhB/YbcL family protein